MMRLGLIRRFYPAIGEHRDIEARLHGILGKCLPPQYLGPLNTPGNPLQSAKKNFFSILFLSVYRAVGIPKERRVFYGMLNHCIRGVVTGADNILDSEYKEMLPLKLPASGVTFKSIMHVLLFQMMMDSVLEIAQDDGIIERETKANISAAILAALMPIGEREAEEEGASVDFLPPDVLLSTVHMFRGGNLLRLAFVAPLLVEKGGELERIGFADKGVYRIGMALQVLDDLTDFYDDLKDGRRNYLASALMFEAPEQERLSLEAFLQGKSKDTPAIETAYGKTIPIIMEKIIGESLAGFALLEQAGLDIDRKVAYKLVISLFELRGLQNLLPLIPPLDRVSLTLGESLGS